MDYDIGSRCQRYYRSLNDTELSYEPIKYLREMEWDEINDETEIFPITTFKGSKVFRNSFRHTRHQLEVIC